MPPYLPVVSLTRSQAVRIGKGPGGEIPQFNVSGTTTNPQTKTLWTAFYANLGSGSVRRDIQRHSSIGALLHVGTATNSVWSDMFKVSGLAVTGGSGFALSVAAGVVQSRFYGASAQLAVSSQSVTPGAPSSFDRVDQVIVNTAGVVSILPGIPASAAAAYEVDSVAITGTPTGGTFTLAFVYGGFTYTTAGIAFNASAATVATAVLAATGGPALPATSIAGTGGALPGTPVTLTASGALEGPITGQVINTGGLTGGTNPAGTFTVTTAGTGASPRTPEGGYLPLANVYIPSTATSASNYTITSIALTS